MNNDITKTKTMPAPLYLMKRSPSGRKTDMVPTLHSQPLKKAHTTKPIESKKRKKLHEILTTATKETEANRVMQEQQREQQQEQYARVERWLNEVTQELDVLQVRVVDGTSSVLGMYEAKFEAARSFELEDDLDFCPH